MQIKVIFNDREVESMVNKMNCKVYSKTQIKSAGAKIQKAYEQFKKTKTEPSKDQMTLDEMIKYMGGRKI